MTGVSFLAVMFSWRPYAWRTLQPGLDPSWQAGLAEGFMRHLAWGPSLVFSFGPYGLVDNVLPFYQATALLAVLYAVLVTWAMAALVVSGLRGSWGLLGAGVAAWGALAIATSRTGYSDVAGATALGLALAVFRSTRPWARLVLLGLLGALAGLQMLVKVNDGLLCLGLVAVAVAFVGAGPGRGAWAKAAVAGGVPLLGVALVAWLAAGQHLGNIPSYLRGSLSVAIGYSSAMGLSRGRVAEDWYALVVVALLAVVFALGRRGAPKGMGLAVFLVFAGWTWANVKEGFVRHDAHDLTFFGLMLAALALVRVERRFMPVQATALALAALLACLAAGGPPEQLHSPGASAAALADDLKAVSGIGGFDQGRSRLRQQLLATGNSLPPAVLGRLEGHTVAIEPAQAAIAYAYPALDWDPEPVLQGYSAYTSYLDRLDAAFLASARAPQRIVYLPSADIDGRDKWLDPPATLESMYCHYAQLPVPGPSQVLTRTVDRCGRQVVLRRAQAHFGDVVEVPRAPGKMVVAAFSFGATLLSDVEGVLLKPPAMSIKVWTAGAPPLSYRFIPGTAGDNHVMSVPPALGYSPSFTPPAIKKLELSGGGWGPGQGRLVITFYALSLHPS